MKKQNSSMMSFCVFVFRNSFFRNSIFKIQNNLFALVLAPLFFNSAGVFGQGDNCNNATAITVGTACAYTTYTNASASNSTTTPLPTCANYSTACEDVWFSATVPASGHLIIDTQTGGITDGGMAIYTGNNCNSLTLVECDDDDSDNGFMPKIDISTIAAGTIVYIRFWEYGGDVTGTFGLCAYDGDAGGGGADPCDDITAIPGCGTGSTMSYNETGTGSWFTAASNACGYFTEGIEQIFSYTPTETGTFNFVVTASSGSYIDVMYQAGSCSSTGWTCIDDIYSTGAYGPIAMTIGTTYYFLLDPEVETQASMSFYISCALPNPCDNVTPIAGCGAGFSNSYNETGSGSWFTAASNACGNWSEGIEQIYSFTPATTGFYSFEATAIGANTIDVMYQAGSCSLTGWSCVGEVATTGSYGPMSLIGGTTYYILLDPEDVDQSTMSFYVSCELPDPCENVISIAGCGSGFTQTFSESGSGLFYNTTSNDCYHTTPGAEQIYSFTAPTSGYYSLNVTAVSGGTVDYLYSASCTAMNWECLTSVSATGVPDSILLSAGSTIYILLDPQVTTATSQTFYFSCPTVSNFDPTAFCTGADPFCTGTTYDFPAGVDAGDGEAGPDYGCLSSTPNPVWYYLQVQTAGPIEIYMYGDAAQDIDFACWGPFPDATSPCTAQLTAGTSTPSHAVAGPSTDYPTLNMVDCSYDGQDEEWCYIPNAQVGQVYVLLITNYSNDPQNIVFSQTGGTGATDCSIVAPPITNNGPLCVGEDLQLSVTNPVAGATYTWTGPNGFTSSAMNPSINNVTTAAAGVYSLVITVGGTSSAPVTTTVVVNPNPTVTASASPATICNGSSSSLTGSSTITGTTYVWNPGGLTGSPVTVSPTATTTYTVTGTTPAGCTGTATVQVTVNQPPVISCPPAYNVAACNGAYPAGATSRTTFNSQGGSAPVGSLVSFVDGTPSVAGCTETVIRTYTVTLNSCPSTCTQTLTRTVDVTPPVITGTLTTTNIEGCAAASAPAAVTTVAALEGMGLAISDGCTADASLTVSSTQTNAGSCPIVITRTYTITDACGNASTVVHTINVDDNTAPVITGTLAATTVEGCAVADAPAAVTTVSALEGMGLAISDGCTADASLTVSSTQTNAGSCPIVITRTYTITDACGNASTVVHTINVDDNTAPVIAGTLTTTNIEGCGAASAPAAVSTVAALEGMGITVTDACTADGSLTVTSAQTSAGTCPIVVTRTYTITDACGNASTVVHTINVDDNTAPVITGTLAATTVEGCAVADAPAEITT
ncbi:MAG: hypothetical protein AB7V36_12360, partial [Bacteroidales bacterium]